MDREQDYWDELELSLKFAGDRPDMPPDNSISEAFRENYSAERYLKLRHDFPRQSIRVSSRAGYSWLLRNRGRLESLGIAFDDVRGALDGKPDNISRLSLHLLELLVDRKRRAKSGEVHLVGFGEAISDSLASFLISLMFDAIDDQEIGIIPRDLVVLIKHHIGAMGTVELKSHDVSEQRQLGLDIGAMCMKVGSPISMSGVAKILQVERSTVLRWFPSTDFQSEVQRWFLVLEEKFGGKWGPDHSGKDK